MWPFSIYALARPTAWKSFPSSWRNRSELMIVMMTAFATIDSAVEAIKRGATDYLPKPFQPAQIRHVIDQCIKRRDLKRQVSELESRLREAAPEVELNSDSPKFLFFLMIRRPPRSTLFPYTPLP